MTDTEDVVATVHKLVADLDYPMIVVTAVAQGRRAGCLVGFSTQCSINPPQFLVCISKRNATFRVANDARVLAMHFLTQDDRELSELFGEQTGDDTDKFAACTWDPGPDGVPIVRAGAGYYVGEVLDRHDVGDHVAFVLRPIAAGEGPSIGAPQLSFQQVKDMEPGHEA